MTTGHLILAIIAGGALTGAVIYLESMRRSARATKIAERKRRAELQRQLRGPRR